ncbi:MAG: hypothetical protein KDI39_15750 [Pseudomonadales bacterium]|nr:hypothetical protein [Pseudomonadales bacterium]
MNRIFLIVIIFSFLGCATEPQFRVYNLPKEDIDKIIPEALKELRMEIVRENKNDRYIGYIEAFKAGEGFSNGETVKIFYRRIDDNAVNIRVLSEGTSYMSTDWALPVLDKITSIREPFLARKNDEILKENEAKRKKADYESLFSSFRGVVFGVNVKEYQDLNYINTTLFADKKIKNYVRKNDSMAIGLASVNAITYGCLDDEVILVNVYFQGDENYSFIKDAIVQRFGYSYQDITKELQSTNSNFGFLNNDSLDNMLVGRNISLLQWTASTGTAGLIYDKVKKSGIFIIRSKRYEIVENEYKENKNKKLKEAVKEAAKKDF